MTAVDVVRRHAAAQVADANHLDVQQDPTKPLGLVRSIDAFPPSDRARIRRWAATLLTAVADEITAEHVT